METKNIILATVICFVILVGWQAFAESMGWIAPAPQTEVIETQTNTTQFETIVDNQGALPSSAPVFAPAEGKLVTVTTPIYKAVFHSAGGVLQSFELENYKATSAPDSPLLNLVSNQAKIISPMGLLINDKPSWNQAVWNANAEDITLTAGQNGSLVFEGRMEGLIIRRELIFDASTYQIKEKVTLQAEQGQAYIARVGYTLASTAFSTESTYDPMKLAWDLDGSFDSNTDVDDLTNEGYIVNGNIFWGGIMNNYFLTAVAPTSKNGILKARIQNNTWRVALETAPSTLNSGDLAIQEVTWWFGPKDSELLSKAPNELSKALDYGFFGILAKPLLWLLERFYSLVHNWGIAIILLTILIKILFWPLTRKSFKSMEQMKRIAPLMEEVKKKHADDKQAMSQEMMQLYKTYNVNPMSGCLPILVQLPVFIALYQALLHSNNLRHAEFITYLPFTNILWLSDLSVQDPLYITPLLMGATMFLQQWLSPAVGDPTQRKVMLFMPLIFTFMFLSFPAGLVLYWLVNNILSIVQQWWTLRRV